MKVIRPEIFSKNPYGMKDTQSFVTYRRVHEDFYCSEEISNNSSPEEQNQEELDLFPLNQYQQLLDESEMINKEFKELSSVEPKAQIFDTNVINGIIGKTPFLQLFNDFYKIPEPNRNVPKKKKVVKKMLTPKHPESKDIQVLSKPARRKFANFAHGLPPSICAKPYWYQIVILTKKRSRISTIVPKFYLEIQRNQKGDEYFPIKDGIIVKEVLKKRKQRELNQYVQANDIQKFKIQFQNTTTKMDSLMVRLCISDSKTKTVIFKSNELKVYARKHNDEEEFWVKCHDQEWENEEEERMIEKETSKNVKKKLKRKRQYVSDDSDDDSDYNRNDYVKRRRYNRPCYERY